MHFLTTACLVNLKADSKGQFCQSKAADNSPYVQLRRVRLSNITLPKASLGGAVLTRANLESAHLPDANLQGANLQGANLTDADLRGADLSNVRGITKEELEREDASLTGTTMPNGQKYEDWLKDKKAQGKDVKNE